MYIQNEFKLDFVGVGFGHSGTSWLFKCLEEHPQIEVSIKKETKFFRDHFDKGIEYYKKFFNDHDEKKIQGEFTPSYVYDQNVPSRIHEMFPNTKIIIIIRDPAEFVRSAYYFNEQRGIISFTDINQKIQSDLKDNTTLGYKIISNTKFNLLPYF